MTLRHTTMNSIRDWLLDEYLSLWRDDPPMIELIGTSFLADEPTIFGEPNDDYIQREIEWYESQSLRVDAIPGDTPAIWEQVCDELGRINSNYGWLIWNAGNGHQYLNVLEELRRNPDSRRGTMIYTRPTMHYDATMRGMSDFICTNAVNYFIRDGALHAVVQMRSNDVVFGYRNDWAWQQHVLEKLADDLEVPAGDMIWQAASLHVYPRHYHLLKEALGL